LFIPTLSFATMHRSAQRNCPKSPVHACGVALRDAEKFLFGLFRPVYRPNPRSERSLYPFSDSFFALSRVRAGHERLTARPAPTRSPAPLPAWRRSEARGGAAFEKYMNVIYRLDTESARVPRRLRRATVTRSQMPHSASRNDRSRSTSRTTSGLLPLPGHKPKRFRAASPSPRRR
jgi:hypothetical protein